MSDTCWFTSIAVLGYLRDRMQAAVSEANVAVPDPLNTTGGVPRVVLPMLPGHASEPFDSPAHIYEVKWEGIRAIAYVHRDGVRLQDRWGREITALFPELDLIGLHTLGSGIVLDGEIVCLDTQGRPDLGRLVARVDPATPCNSSDPPTVFQAFDIIYREGQAVTGWPLRRRKEMLLSVVRPRGPVAVPDWIEREGVPFFEAARDHGLAGIVAKESESTYSPGERCSSWLTIDVRQKGHFVVGGYAYGGVRHPLRHRTRAPALSLLIGRFGPGGNLQYIGRVHVGVAGEEITALLRRLEDHTRPDCPFGRPPDVGELVSWCRPDLVVTVAYAHAFEDGSLRFPVLEAIRPDVPASSCVVEEAA